MSAHTPGLLFVVIIILILLAIFGVSFAAGFIAEAIIEILRWVLL